VVWAEVTRYCPTECCFARVLVPESYRQRKRFRYNDFAVYVRASLRWLDAALITDPLHRDNAVTLHTQYPGRT
jgi:hypothetical protein